MHAVVHGQLFPDPEQVRRRIRGLNQLADSIAEYGLLENLVVREHPSERGAYYIVAGERRWQAIGILIKQGRWNANKPIPVMVVSTDGVWENIVENDLRQEVTPWDLGFKFCALLDAGTTQQEIAARLHTVQGRVSRHVQIARGLAPEAIAFCERLPGTRWTVTDLLRVSKLVKKGGDIERPEPDVEKQLATLKRVAGLRGTRRVRTRRGESKDEKEAVFKRFKKLRDEVGVSGEYQHVVDAVVDYLAGKTRRLKV